VFQLDLPVLEKILRVVMVYGFLVVGLRLAGKRELAQLNPFDLVVFLTLSNALQNAIIGNDNSVTGGIISAVTLLVLNSLVVRFLYRHRSIDRLVEGKPEVLIENGKVKREHLRGELITMSELESAAHKQGFRSLAEVDRAVLEPGGSLTFTAKEPSPPELRHQQIMDRLDAVTAELARLKGHA